MIKHIDTGKKAITTKYISATDFRGARIKASDGDGNTATISYPYELSYAAVHFEAAKALCEKMKWNGMLASGNNGKGYTFLFVED
jgi:hypothetical protein